MRDRLLRKQCKYCRSVFYSKNPNRYYCSKQCQQIAYRRKQKMKGQPRNQEWYVIVHHERLNKQLEQEREEQERKEKEVK